MDNKIAPFFLLNLFLYIILSYICYNSKFNVNLKLICLITDILHYCRKRMLPQLKTAFSPGFSTGTTLPGQKVPIFYPGWFNRDKSNFISRLKFSTGNKEGEKTKKKLISAHPTAPLHLRLDHHHLLFQFQDHHKDVQSHLE